MAVPLEKGSTMRCPASSLFFHFLKRTGRGHVFQVLLGASSASAPSPACCLGWHDGPCSKQLVIFNAFIPMPRCSPRSHKRPYAGAQEKARQEGCNPMAFPGLPWWATWRVPLLLHPSPDHPSGPRHRLFLPHGPGRQQDGAGGETASSGRSGATLPGPKGWEPWARLVAMAEQWLSQQPQGPPLQAPTMGTAGLPTRPGGKAFYLNKPKQIKPLKLYFFSFLFSKQVRTAMSCQRAGCEGLSTTWLVLS